jgi:hypothetical protein
MTNTSVDTAILCLTSQTSWSVEIESRKQPKSKYNQNQHHTSSYSPEASNITQNRLNMGLHPLFSVNCLLKNMARYRRMDHVNNRGRVMNSIA